MTKITYSLAASGRSAQQEGEKKYTQVLASKLQAPLVREKREEPKNDQEAADKLCDVL